jgi:hypothetical protein
MENSKNKALKLILVCVLCIGLVTGLAYLIQFLIS